MRPFDTITLDKNSEIPLYRQLGEAIRTLIADGVLPPDQKLPPIRVMAKELSINTMTVVSAYKYLESKKFVYSAVGSGTYVSPLPNAPLPAPILKNQYNARQPFTGRLTDAINFADTSTDASLFPVDAFGQAFNEVLARDKGAAFDYQDSQGYEPLRESLCGYLESFSVKESPDHIQIISGAQQGLDILAKALLDTGDVLLVEQPTFYGAVGAFASRGAQVAEFPLEKDGPDMDKLEALLKLHRPKCVYVMPNFQTPTGISYSNEKKRRLLELAYKYEVYVIEEDNQNDFYYDGHRRIPLKALDYRNRVIYVKSFSKILMPGLRMGFMAMPKKLVVTSVKRNTDIATSGFIQRAFDLYLRGGALHTHCAHIRAVYGVRYRQTLEAVETYLSPYVHYDPPGGGLSFWLSLKPGRTGGSMEELCGTLLQRGVIVTPGDMFSLRGGESASFRISFAAVPEARITEGINLIALAINTHNS